MSQITRASLLHLGDPAGANDGLGVPACVHQRWSEFFKVFYCFEYFCEHEHESQHSREGHCHIDFIPEYSNTP